MIAADICNSLADVDGQLEKRIQGYCNKQYPFPIPEGYFASPAGFRVFRDAEPFPGSARLLSSLAELFDGVVYVTTRPPQTGALTRKWLARYGYPYGKLIFCKWQEKVKVYSSLKPHLIIEDDPRVLEEIKEIDVPVIVPQWPYNSHIRGNKIIPVNWTALKERVATQWR